VEKGKRVAQTAAESIIVKGARTHNLKNISVEMPRNAMVAITGMSGSGKSSLAFDTIFAEGQRRFFLCSAILKSNAKA
jgi:excinuclease ABC subunit A